jgi:hypothetical protein
LSDFYQISMRIDILVCLSMTTWRKRWNTFM